MAEPLITTSALPAYAELHALSNFSFQRGASHAEELVARAHALGYSALAITDECSMAGVVRAHVEAKRLCLKLLIGTELRINTSEDGGDYFTLVLLARSRAGYGQLCELITRARAQPDGKRLRRYRLDQTSWHELGFDSRDVLALLVPRRDGLRPEEPQFAEQLIKQLHWLREHFPQRGWIAVELLHRLDDDLWLEQLRLAGERCSVPLVAAGNVHMHGRG